MHAAVSSVMAAAAAGAAFSSADGIAFLEENGSPSTPHEGDVLTLIVAELLSFSHV